MCLFILLPEGKKLNTASVSLTQTEREQGEKIAPLLALSINCPQLLTLTFQVTLNLNSR